MITLYEKCISNSNNQGGCRGRVRMVIGFTTTCAISAYHASWRGILDTTFVSDLRQVTGFLG